MTKAKKEKVETLTKIYSMCANGHKFTGYKERSKSALVEVNTVVKEVLIKGGAKVAYSDDERVKRNQDYVITLVNSEDLKFLKENPVFNRIVERGFITIGEAPKTIVTDASGQISKAQLSAKAPEYTVTVDKA